MGNGMNYIREILSMNLPDTPVEKTVKAAATEGFSRYQFVGYMDDDEFLLTSNNRVVVRLRKGDRGRVQVRAHAGDVIMHRKKLYAWCQYEQRFDRETGRPYQAPLVTGCWLEFNPGQCTPYNGPVPEKVQTNEYRFIGYLNDRSFFDLKNRNVVVRESIGGYSTEHKSANRRDVIMWRNQLYAWLDTCWFKFNPGSDSRYHGPTPDESLEPYNKEENMAETRYDRIPYGFMTIKNVVFNNPATIVMWADGSKTVVKCGENEEFDPEKGLTMAIAKKAFGNQGNYYNQIKKWLPKMEEGPVVNVDGGSILDSIRRVNEHIADVADSISHKLASPQIHLAKQRLAAAQELICDMSFNGATKAELMRAIRYSKELIDATKGADVDINAVAKDYGIVELVAKYKTK